MAATSRKKRRKAKVKNGKQPPKKPEPPKALPDGGLRL
jgi:hypothetical protein